MARIVEVHYPGIKRRLIEEALRIFFEVREVPGLRKKPSTSELLDWLKLLLSEDIGPEQLRERDTAQAHSAAARGAPQERAGREPVREARPSCQSGKGGEGSSPSLSRQVVTTEIKMRRLMLLRHAKSDWPTGLLDIDRPLAARGRDAAPRMGAHLRDEQLLPDLVLVSPARRARETWELVQPCPGEVETRFDPRIYEAPRSGLLALVRAVEPADRARS